jgi:hypothetical protein
VTVKVRIPVGKILAAHGMGSSGKAQKALALAVRQRCDKYVPYDTGRLKNSARVSADGLRITYPQDYAAKQFYGNYRHRDPNRGARWHSRMLNQEKDALVKQMARYWKEGRI